VLVTTAIRQDIKRFDIQLVALNALGVSFIKRFTKATLLLNQFCSILESLNLIIWHNQQHHILN